MQKQKNNQRGITLIALVVSIVVLIILAGVSIAMLVGENGIITQAQRAKENTELAEQKEKEDMESLENQMNEYLMGIKQVTDENPGTLEGNGTATEPYTINSIEDLVVFAYNTRNGTTYKGEFVNLGLSLDFKSDKSYIQAEREDYAQYGYTGNLKEALTSGNGWIPIDNFYGTFDGKDNIISGMYISFNSDSNDFTGLFRNNYGTIKNLGVDNISISVISQSNYSYVGGICGINGGNIVSCYTSGSINSNYKNSILGGICARTEVGSSVELCGSNVNITGKSIQCGGVVGQNNSDVEKCYNRGNIHLDYASHVGGIVGLGSTLETNVISCYNKGSLTVTDSEGAFNLGGIVGQQNAGTINACYNTGNIVGNSSIENSRIGGICAYPSMVWLYGLYNLGDITAEGPNFIISGIGAVNAERTIKGAYNEGEILYDNYENVGAISGIGYEGCAAIEDIFYYYSLNKAFKTEHPDEATFKLTSVIDKNELLNILNATGHGSYFIQDTNYINNGYPVLEWQ